MKNNKRKILIISSVIIILLAIIIRSTWSLSNDIIIVCDTPEMLPNSETLCHVSGVASQSVSAVELYLTADNEIDLEIISHNESWENYNEEYGEVIMLSINEFTNTFDLLTFKVKSGNDLGNYKIYLTNGKMVENGEYTIKTIEDKEIEIRVVDELNSSASSSQPASSSSSAAPASSSQPAPSSSSAAPASSSQQNPTLTSCNFETNFTIKNNYIINNVKNINKGTYIESLSTNNNCNISITNKNNTELSSNDKVGTGSKINIYSGSTLLGTYTNILKGDNNGDGNIDISDLTRVYKHYRNKTIMTEDYYIEASDINSDGNIDISDLTMIYKAYRKTN